MSAFSQYFRCMEMLRFNKYLQYTKKFGAGALAHANVVLHATRDEESTSYDKNFSFGACLKRSIHIAQ